MPQMSQVLKGRAIGVLTAGMSTRAVARELDVHFSTISVVLENLA
jgi:transposase